MRPPHRSQPLTPSLLDRLIDNDPDGPPEPPASPHQVLREQKESLRRDLQNLLNTRVRNVTWEENLAELDGSLLDYGLPDFLGINLGSESSRLQFCRTLETIIRQHEPRLTQVKVMPKSDNEPLDRTFHFRINATLKVEPVPERVVFDSTVQPATGDVEVGRAEV